MIGSEPAVFLGDLTAGMFLPSAVAA